MAIKSADRIPWIDTLKAIGVTLVILGHTVGVPPLILQLIFSFHIPLFFWMSGLVGTGKVNSMSMWHYVQDRARRRLIPYFAFALVSYLLWVFFLRFLGTRQAAPIPPYVPLLGIFYGSNVNDYLAPNVVLWFFPCLFTTEILFYCLLKIRSIRLLVMALLSCSLLGYFYTAHFSFRFPWGADIALTAVIFYSAGYWSRQFLSHRILSMPIFVIMLFSSLPLYIICSLYNTPVAMIIGNYGDNYYLFYLAAFAGIVFWTTCASFMGGISFLRLIGQQTLVLFSLHLLVFPFITGFFLYILKLTRNFREQSVAYAILYTGISIAVLIPISFLLEKHFPALLGKAAKREDFYAQPKELLGIK
jgi:acyltransferase